MFMLLGHAFPLRLNLSASPDIRNSQADATAHRYEPLHKICPISCTYPEARRVGKTIVTADSNADRCLWIAVACRSKVADDRAFSRRFISFVSKRVSRPQQLREESTGIDEPSFYGMKR